ncbi:hypothetical protein NQ176_g10877 [Zarea fungicola]|uniref:Uncharacterized protein n=1 Tax=Zarea fungicola TaxID=93591 RepID=A0ACC1MD61_9HYPO|nr:hypothetical protein NQ176_g10877 [Lecanicillium fungicola]
MEMSFGAVARIRGLAESTPREKDAGGGQEDVSEHWPLTGKLELDGVTAVYKPESEKPHTALDNISFTVEPGDTVGIVGRTGSGKSSLLLALLHLVEYSGTIRLDGRDIKTVERKLLRTRITTVPQGGLELLGSVRFNMDPFKFGPRQEQDAYPNDEDLATILRCVGLWSTIAEAGGLDVTMAKLKLSHGQRQLFQLARAILHHEVTGSKLLLMDEGTASMDAETETRVRHVMAEAFSACTKVIISHRSTLLAAAQVVVRLDQGRARVTRQDGIDGEKSSENGEGGSSRL